MTRIILVRSCMTDFDDEGRIKGTLDLPLNEEGNEQAELAANALGDSEISLVYCSPGQASEQTAEILGRGLGVRVKPLKYLQNLDQGLWQGMLVDDLKEKQKKVYRQWQEQPEMVCPPEGEMVADAQQRIKAVLDKIVKKHKQHVVALVVPEPLASLVRSYLEQTQVGDLWEAICTCGTWQTIDVEPQQLAAMAATQA